MGKGARILLIVFLVIGILWFIGRFIMVGMERAEKRRQEEGLSLQQNQTETTEQTTTV